MIKIIIKQEDQRTFWFSLSYLAINKVYNEMKDNVVFCYRGKCSSLICVLSATKVAEFRQSKFPLND